MKRTIIAAALFLASLGAALGQPVYPQNYFYAGPTSGSGFPKPRAIVGGDLPNPSASTLGGIQSLTCAANNWLNTISIAGVPACAQPNFNNLAGTLALSQFGTIAANSVLSNWTSGVAVPIFNTWPACANDGLHALVYINGTGLQCATLTAALIASAPQGRLTLISNTPVATSSTAGASTLYYTPALGGGYVPTTADGATFTMTQFAQVSQATTDATKSPAAAIANANYDIFCWVDGGTKRCTRGDYWKTASATITVTIASPAVLTCGTCAFNVNFNPPIVLATTGALPTGLVAGTTYYLTPTAATTANISATPGGANINTSGSQSGTQSAIIGDDFGTTYRSGTTSLTTVAGTPLNTSSITNGPAALRGTYVGTVRTDASSLLNMTYGSTSAGGGPALLHVFNQYNQVPVAAIVGDSTASWAYTSATVRAMDNSNGNRVSFLAGTQANPLAVKRDGHATVAAVAGALASVGYALDRTNGYDVFSFLQTPSAFALAGDPRALGNITPQIGAHFVQALESGDGANASTLQGASNLAFFNVQTWQ